MQIILVHPRFATAKCFSLHFYHWFATLFLFVSLVIGSAILLNLFVLTDNSDSLSPADSFTHATSYKNNTIDHKESLAVIAMKLGEMQAQLVRLDALGAKIQGIAGIQPQEFNFQNNLARGGLEITSAPKQLSIIDIQKILNKLATGVEQRIDYMNIIDATLQNNKIQNKLLPTTSPTNSSYNASSYGWRIDPFSSRMAFHEGIDFPSPIGSAINAAAPGVVIFASFHPQYGNMIDIDHGNNLTTRYAHASKLLVQVGDIIKGGQHIANIGSTGRSTGPHLHFEIRHNNVAQDPAKFLALESQFANHPLNLSNHAFLINKW